MTAATSRRSAAPPPPSRSSSDREHVVRGQVLRSRVVQAHLRKGAPERRPADRPRAPCPSCTARTRRGPERESPRSCRASSPSGTPSAAGPAPQLRGIAHASASAAPHVWQSRSAGPPRRACHFAHVEPLGEDDPQPLERGVVAVVSRAALPPPPQAASRSPAANPAAASAIVAAARLTGVSSARASSAGDGRLRAHPPTTRSRLRRERRRKSLVVGLDGHRDARRNAATKRSVSCACLPCSPRRVSGSPTTTSSASCSATSEASSSSPASSSARGPRTAGARGCRSRRRQRPRCGPSRSRVRGRALWNGTVRAPRGSGAPLRQAHRGAVPDPSRPPGPSSACRHRLRRRAPPRP